MGRFPVMGEVVYFAFGGRRGDRMNAGKHGIPVQVQAQRFPFANVREADVQIVIRLFSK